MIGYIDLDVIYAESFLHVWESRLVLYARWWTHVMVLPNTISHDVAPIYPATLGETAWSRSGQHTGRTDLPLERGCHNASRLSDRLRGMTFAKVFTSPLQRVAYTCKLACFGSAAVIDDDLFEWNYGEYEGMTSAQIRLVQANWDLFRDSCPGGESPEQIGGSADLVVAKVRAVEGDVLIFSSGCFPRVLAARWLGLEPRVGKYCLLNTASLSAPRYEHYLSQPVMGCAMTRST
jgi:probable phosphoglycerate mutase